MNVYVRNHDGRPLMPCLPAKARKLLRAGKAKVVDRCPFTIQLLWQCEEHLQVSPETDPQAVSELASKGERTGALSDV
jgi:RRXRR protein